MPVSRAYCLVFGFCFVVPAMAAAQQGRLAERVIVERDVEYGKAGERSLKLDVLRPKEPAAPKLPILVFVHGGGWQGGNKSAGINALAPAVATGKYVGVTVGYRLTGEAPWPAQIHDCKAAIRWVKANADMLKIDPEKIGVWGQSAGGHLVSMLGTTGDTAELDGKNGNVGQNAKVACVVDYCGPSDLTILVEVLIATGRAKSSPALTNLFGGPLDQKRDVAKQASPVQYVTAGDAPFLIVHGTSDPVVPYGQATTFHAALQKAGVESVLLTVQGGGHSLNYPNVPPVVAQFLAKQLHGETVELRDLTVPAEIPAAPVNTTPSN